MLLARLLTGLIVTTAPAKFTAPEVTAIDSIKLSSESLIRILPLPGTTLSSRVTVRLASTGTSEALSAGDTVTMTGGAVSGVPYLTCSTFPDTRLTQFAGSASDRLSVMAPPSVSSTLNQTPGVIAPSALSSRVPLKFATTVPP